MIGAQVTLARNRFVVAAFMLPSQCLLSLPSITAFYHCLLSLPSTTAFFLQTQSDTSLRPKRAAPDRSYQLNKRPSTVTSVLWKFGSAHLVLQWRRGGGGGSRVFPVGLTGRVHEVRPAVRSLVPPSAEVPSVPRLSAGGGYLTRVVVHGWRLVGYICVA